MNHFKDKIVWITGASSGIGEALTHCLARQGAKLILTSRREEQLTTVAQAAGLSAEDCLILPMDMGQLTQAHITQALAAITEKFKRLDYVFLNAGLSQRYHALDNLTMDVDRQLMEVNFFAPVLMAKTIAQYFKQQGNGHLVVTSSVFGKMGFPGRGMYCASKHALHGFFDSLRIELHADNIQCSLAVLGAIKTQVAFNALTANGHAHRQQGRWQAKGYPAEKCAQKILHHVARNNPEFTVGGHELLGLRIRQWLPRLYNRMARKYIV
jgi:short-subunit dehydrogenase